MNQPLPADSRKKWVACAESLHLSVGKLDKDGIRKKIHNTRSERANRQKGV